MVALSNDAENTLESYIASYAGYRLPKEYGTSSFWNWFYQVKNYILSLDKLNNSDGENLKYKMKYWGSIIYSKHTTSEGIFIMVGEFEFNQSNFFKWINHVALYKSPKTVTQPARPIQYPFPNGYDQPIGNGYNGLYIVRNTKSRLYTIRRKNGNPFIKGYYDSVRWYGKNNVLAIATKGNAKYYIDYNGCITINEEKIRAILREVINEFIQRELIA